MTDAVHTTLASAITEAREVRLDLADGASVYGRPHALSADWLTWIARGQRYPTTVPLALICEVHAIPLAATRSAP